MVMNIANSNNNENKKNENNQNNNNNNNVATFDNIFVSMNENQQTGQRHVHVPGEVGYRARITKYKMLLSRIFWAYFFSIFRGFEEINQWWDYGKTENKFPLLNLYIEQLLVSLGTHNFENEGHHYQ